MESVLKELDNALKEYDNATYELHLHDRESTDHFPLETEMKIIGGTQFHIPEEILDTLTREAKTIKGMAGEYMDQEEKAINTTYQMTS